MSDKYKNIKAGKPVTYKHEEYMLTDSKGVNCNIRASFDKDRFFMRSAHIVTKLEKGITHSVPIPVLDISIIGTEEVESPHREKAGPY